MSTISDSSEPSGPGQQHLIGDQSGEVHGTSHASSTTSNAAPKEPNLDRSKAEIVFEAVRYALRVAPEATGLAKRALAACAPETTVALLNIARGIASPTGIKGTPQERDAIMGIVQVVQAGLSLANVTNGPEILLIREPALRENALDLGRTIAGKVRAAASPDGPANPAKDNAKPAEKPVLLLRGTPSVRQGIGKNKNEY